MKIILLQDVAKIGKRYDVAEVSSGFALNKLIPQKMAELASPSNMKKIERRQAETSASKKAGQDRFESAATSLRATTLKLTTEVNEKGHLFKAVHESDIVTAAKASDITIEDSMVLIDSPIKEVGEHTVTLKDGESKAEFTIEVIKK